MIAAAQIAAAFLASCRDEIEAPKPGNVHHFAAGHGMTADEFLASAAAAAPPLAMPRRRVGERILAAAEATAAAVGKNTNLGILLLCGPLAAAAERAGGEPPRVDLRGNVEAVLEELDRTDAQNVFAAICLARPAGLGSAPRHDVRAPATASLREAMAEAAQRDRIAHQYAAGFDDIFKTGFAALAEARRRRLPPPWRTVLVYLAFLAAFPDTHVLRKEGIAAAIEVQRRGGDMLALFRRKYAGSLADLLALDGELKAANRNPGTSADLTVATLFADRLRRILLRRRNDG